MPRAPTGLGQKWDLNREGSRHTLRPAVAFGAAGLDGLPDVGALKKFVESQGAGWLLGEQDALGEGHLVNGGIGRGAEGDAVVVEWLFEPVTRGLIELAVVLAAKRVLDGLREVLQKKPKRKRQPRPFISRGMAVLAAAAEIASEHDGDGPFEFEAAEEPRSIAGEEISELSYTGLDPWVVMLLNRERKTRYVAVVDPYGTVLSVLASRIGKWEMAYLPAPAYEFDMDFDNDSWDDEAEQTTTDFVDRV